MLKTLRFLFVAAIIAASVAWLLDNNGSVLIYWLGREIRTDILTAILLLIFFAVLVFALSYVVVKIASIRFPHLSLKFKRNKNDE